MKKSYKELKIIKKELNNQRSQLKNKKSDLREMNELISQKNNLIKSKISEIKELKLKRDDFNKLASKFKNEREQLKDRLKEIKSKLDEYFNMFNKLKGSVEGNTKAALNKISDLDWKIQTSVMPLKKEGDMVKRIEKLTRDLEVHKKIDDIIAEINKLKQEKRFTKEKIDEAHLYVISNATKSKPIHEQILKKSQEVSDIDYDVKNLIKKKEKIKNKYLEVKDKFIQIKKQKNEIKRALDEEKAKNIAKKSQEKNKELKKKADEVLNRFRSGSKIEYDDMVLLQKFELL